MNIMRVYIMYSVSGCTQKDSFASSLFHWCRRIDPDFFHTLDHGADVFRKDSMICTRGKLDSRDFNIHA